MLISGKTRLRILTRFFLVPDTIGHLRGLAEEFGESTNAIRLELNRFEQGGLLISGMEQNRKVFRANISHPLFADIASILRKHTGVDRLVEQVINRIGNISQAYITGELAMGRNSNRIDLLLVGEEINLENLRSLTAKAEKVIDREIVVTVMTPNEAIEQIGWRKDVWKILGK